MVENHKHSPFDIEAAMIRNALGVAGHDRGLAARLLGIIEAELESRLRLHGLILDESSEH